MAARIEICPKVCPERSSWCHATCERYKQKSAEYQEKREEILNARRQKSSWTYARVTSFSKRVKKQAKSGSNFRRWGK